MADFSAWPITISLKEQTCKYRSRIINPNIPSHQKKRDRSIKAIANGNGAQRQQNAFGGQVSEHVRRIRTQIDNSRHARFFAGETDGVGLPVDILSFKDLNVTLAFARMPANLIKGFAFRVHHSDFTNGTSELTRAIFPRTIVVWQLNETTTPIGRSFRLSGPRYERECKSPSHETALPVQQQGAELHERQGTRAAWGLQCFP